MSSMKLRAAEILFKNKVIILLPLLIIVPLTTMVALRPRPVKWQSFGVIWVDQYRPLYTDERLGYTPAANQAQLLNDLLRTRSFSLEVLNATPVAPTPGDAEAERDAIQFLWSSVRVGATSNNFVMTMASTGDPELSQQLAKAVMTSFERVLQTRTEMQSKLALAFYGDALTKAEQTMEKSRAELATYIAAHPELNRPTTDTLGPTARDAKLARLLGQVNTDQQNYDGLRRRSDEIQANAAAGVEGQRLAFTVVDEPQVPLDPVVSRRFSVLKLPLVGTVMGLLLGAGLAVWLVLTNRAVLGTRDIQVSLGVPVLGEIPELRRRRWPWQPSPRDAVRLRLTTPARLASPESKGA